MNRIGRTRLSIINYYLKYFVNKYFKYLLHLNFVLCPQVSLIMQCEKRIYIMTLLYLLDCLGSYESQRCIRITLLNEILIATCNISDLINCMLISEVVRMIDPVEQITIQATKNLELMPLCRNQIL
jgi:hypothetical protein